MMGEDGCLVGACGVEKVLVWFVYQLIRRLEVERRRRGGGFSVKEVASQMNTLLSDLQTTSVPHCK